MDLRYRRVINKQTSDMKKYIQYLSVAAAALLLASCAKLAPGKAEVEAGFDAPAALPALSLGTLVECDALNGVATVSVTVSGLPADLTDLSLGMLSSTDPSFSSSKFVPVAEPAEGTVEMNAAVSANSTYYLKAVAASPKGGTVYSDVITVSVPDIPLWAKASGTYTGTVLSDAYGDSYANVLTISSDEEDPEHYCYISGIEPYYYSKGYTLEKNGRNYVRAEIDEESGCLIVPLGADLSLGGSYLLGLNAPHYTEASAYAPITFKMTASGDLYRAEGFYTVTEDDEIEDAYAGGVTYKRK